MTTPVVHMHFHGSSVDGATQRTGLSSGNEAGAAASVNYDIGQTLSGSDPFAIAKDFPDRWARFIQSICHSPLQVQWMFRVSERTAYRWWNGKGGAHGHHVVFAMQANPALAQDILFAVAA